MLESIGRKDIKSSNGVSWIRATSVTFVMPMADNDLQFFLEMQGATHIESSRHWAKGLADAIAWIHNARIIHRDIKPSNVLLRFDASFASPGGMLQTVAMLADFGSARYPPRATRCASTPAPEPARGLKRTDKGFNMTAMVCTAWYRAPELLTHCT